MEYALFLTSSGEIRKVREYATLAEAEQAAAANKPIRKKRQAVVK